MDSNKFQKIEQYLNVLSILKSIIGKGSFGQVWKGKWRQTQVAIKQIKQEIIDEKSNKYKI